MIAPHDPEQQQNTEDATAELILCQNTFEVKSCANNTLYKTNMSHLFYYIQMHYTYNETILQVQLHYLL
jgi:hypothetical protein